ncbi:hypothetical protein D3C80_1098260 [compost metagenome]
MAFIGIGIAVLHPRPNRRSAGLHLQVRGHPAAGAQFQAGVLLLALLHVGEVTGAVRAGVLVCLANLEQCGAEAQALPVVLEAQFHLVRGRRCQDFESVLGEPGCGTASRQAFGIAGIYRGIRLRLVDKRSVGQQLVLPSMATGNAVLIPGFLVQAYFTGTQHGLPVLVEADAVAHEQPVLAAVQATFARPDGLVGWIKGRCTRVDVACTYPFHIAGALIQRAPLSTGAHGQLMPYAQCIETPVEHGLRLIGAAGVVGAAEVVDVVVAVAAEERAFA